MSHNFALRIAGLKNTMLFITTITNYLSSDGEDEVYVNINFRHLSREIIVNQVKWGNYFMDSESSFCSTSDLEDQQLSWRSKHRKIYFVYWNKRQELCFKAWSSGYYLIHYLCNARNFWNSIASYHANLHIFVEVLL